MPLVQVGNGRIVLGKIYQSCAPQDEHFITQHISNISFQ